MQYVRTLRRPNRRFAEIRLGDRLAVGQQILTLFTVVRIHVPQPISFTFLVRLPFDSCADNPIIGLEMGEKMSILVDWWFGINRKILQSLPQDRTTQDLATQLMIGARGVKDEFKGHARMVLFRRDGHRFLANVAKIWAIFTRSAYKASAAAYTVFREYERLKAFPTCHEEGQRPRWAVNTCVDSRVRAIDRMALVSGDGLIKKDVGATLHSAGRDQRQLSEEAKRWLALSSQKGKSVDAIILSSHGDCGYIRKVSGEGANSSPDDPAARLLDGISTADSFLLDKIREKGVDFYRNKIRRTPKADDTELSRLQDALEIAGLLHGCDLVLSYLRDELKADIPVYCVHFGVSGGNPHLFLPKRPFVANDEDETAIRLTNYSRRLHDRDHGIVNLHRPPCCEHHQSEENRKAG